MPLDDHPGTFHAGAFTEGGQLVSVATVYPEDLAEAYAYAPAGPKRTGPAYRLRGMATLPEAQRQGAGRAVLTLCRQHARAHASSFVWCNARTGALDFYRREGFVTVGEEFEIEPIGPHYVMWRPA
jgi:ribosomal protein S18 acetylase RimI-like enzyme